MSWKSTRALCVALPLFVISTWWASADSAAAEHRAATADLSATDAQARHDREGHVTTARLADLEGQWQALLKQARRLRGPEVAPLVPQMEELRAATALEVAPLVAHSIQLKAQGASVDLDEVMAIQARIRQASHEVGERLRQAGAWRPSERPEKAPAGLIAATPAIEPKVTVPTVSVAPIREVRRSRGVPARAALTASASPMLTQVEAPAMRTARGDLQPWELPKVERVVRPPQAPSPVAARRAAQGPSRAPGASSISGTITDDASGLPLWGGSVCAYDVARGDEVCATAAPTSGAYSIAGIAGGSYVVYAKAPGWTGSSPATYYVSETQSGEHCPGEDPWNHRTYVVTVGEGAPLGGVNIALDAGGAISGALTDDPSGTPLPGWVTAYDATGRWVGNWSTDGVGAFTTAPLLQGTYHLLGQATAHVSEMYPNLVCSDNCGGIGGDPVTVVAGATVSASWALRLGATISGQAVDGATASALTDGYVSAVKSNGNPVGYSGSIDGSGHFTITGLPAGSYFLYASDNTDHVATIYQDGAGLSCPFWRSSCPWTSGSVVAVADQEDRSGIVLEMERGGRIAGTVTDALSGQPIVGPADANNRVRIYDQGGIELGSAYSSDGTYLTPVLAPGMYYAVAWFADHVNELYSDIPCPSGGCAPISGTALPVTAGGTASANFALARGAGIGGSVTDQSSNPLTGGTIQVYDATGYWLKSAPVDAEGDFVVWGLTGGTYYVWASGFTGFVNAFYPNAACFDAGWCDGARGTGVSVANDTLTPGVDFHLSPGAHFSGNVTDAATGDPLLVSWIEIWNADTQRWIGYMHPDEAGAYTSPALAAGRYGLLANADGYVRQLYSGQSCGGACDVSTATLIDLAVGTPVTGVHFPLLRGGSITGRVTDELSGLPLSIGWLEVRDAQDHYWGSVRAGTDGRYTLSGLSTGDYFVRAYDFGPYIGELYDNVPRPACCNLAGGTSVHVTQGATTGGIDFQLAIGGTIVGRLTDAGTSNPIVDGYVDAYDPSGNYVSRDWVDATGHYEVQGLPAGSYYLVARAEGFVNEIYNDIPCTNCSNPQNAGAAVPVDAGATSANVDFALSRGATIEGTVTEEGTGTPLTSGRVEAGDASGYWKSAEVDPAGHYSIGGLMAGSYRLRTYSFAPHVDELYDNLPCPSGSCNTNAGATVTVAATETARVDFALARGAVIDGHVVEDGTGTPLAGGWAEVQNVTSGNWASARADASGYFSIGGLLAGSYRLRVYGFGNHVGELYNGIPCPGLACNVNDGAPIAVVGTSTTTVNFSLARGGTIAGQVVEEGTATPLTGGWVYAGYGPSNYGASQRADASGHYAIEGLPAGTYPVWTSGFRPYVDELHDDLPCPSGSCNRNAGTRVTVAVDAITTVPFALQRGGAIHGSVTDASLGTPLTGGYVYVYSSSGGSAGSSSVDATGAYVVEGLAPGAYFASAQNFAGHVSAGFGDVPCGGSCYGAVGSPIVVTIGATATADFHLSLGGSIAGQVTDTLGAALSGASVSAYTQGGSNAFMGGTNTDATGAFTINGLGGGNYYLRASATDYISEEYDDVLCASSCSYASGTPVSVTAGTTTPGIVFALARGGSIAGTVVDQLGAPVASADIRLYNEAGTQVDSARGNASGVYRVDGLMPGRYFVTAQTNGLVCAIFASGPLTCVGHQPFEGTAIDLGPTEDRTGVDFTLVAGGWIAGHVVEAGTGTPLSGASVMVGSLAAGITSTWSVTTDASGAFQTGPALPTGAYYVQASAAGHVSSLYDAVPCLGCNTSVDGTPVAVTTGVGETGIDFDLPVGGTISGRVLDASTRVPVGGSVAVYDPATGLSPASAWVDQYSGSSYTTGGLPSGDYAVQFVTWNSSSDYVDELYEGIVCTGWATPCGLPRATPVPVAVGANTPNINLDIDQGGHIAGVVTDQTGATALANVTVKFYDAYGYPVGTAATNASGAFQSNAFAPGTYYARTLNFAGYFDQDFGGQACANDGCVLNGTPIVVEAHATTPHVDFRLSAGAGITGTVTLQGLPPGRIRPSTLVSIFNAAGQLYDSWESTVKADGTYGTAALPDGTYYLAARALGFVAELYPNVACNWPACNFALGTPIIVSGGVPQPAVANFELGYGALSIGDVAVPEGDSGATDALFTLTLSAPANQGYVHVDYATQDGTAQAPSDYVAASGTVIFAPGETSRTVAVPIVGDSVVEPSKTFTLTLSNPINATLLDGVGVGTIVNDDGTPVVQLSSAAYSVGEDAGQVTITVTRTGGLSAGPTVDYSTSDGSASAGTDYTATSGTVTFGLGESTRTFAVPILANTVFGSDRAFNVSLANAQGGATLGSPATAVVTITEDDLAGQVQFSSATAQAPENGGVATITVTRTGGAASGVTVDYAAAAGGSATVGVDFSLAAGTLTFGAGETSKTFAVTLDDDALVEGDETLNLTLTNPQGGATLGTPDSAVLTILDDDSGGVVQLAASTFAADEDAGALTVSVTRTGGVAGGVTVDYATTDGTALAGTHYTETHGTLTFGAGEVTKAIPVPLFGDTLAEPDTALSFALSNPQGGATLGAPDTAVLTIRDDDLGGQVQFSAIDFKVSEGDAVATIYVTRSGGAASDVTVAYETADGAASAGADYTPAAGVLTFGAGQATQTFTVPILSDTLDEGNETVNLTLSAPTGGATLGPWSTSTLTIEDDEQKLQFSLASYSVSEAATSTTITVKRTGLTAPTVTVDYAATDGTATGGEDFTPTSGTLTFGPGVTTRTFVVPLLPDTNDEDNETLNLTLSNPGGATLGAPATATLTITDNDQAGAVQFGAATYSVKEDAATARISVTRSGGTAGGATVDYATSDGTATAVDDYGLTSGTLTFAAGQTTQEITVPIVGDTTAEGNETVNLTLSNPGGGLALGARPTAILTILDNEPSLAFALPDYTVTEGGTVSLRVQRTGALTSQATVHYATADGSALAGTDYTAKSGTLTFRAGVATATITIVTLNDAISEPDKTLSVTLDSPTASSLGEPSTATILIADNDPAGAVQFKSATYTVGEALSSILITVTRSGGTAGGVTVDFTASDATATAGADYTAVSGTLSFGVGQTTRTFSVPILADTLLEEAETVDLALSNITGGATAGPQATAALVILDNDGPHLQFSAAKYLVSEGTATAVITVKRTAPLSVVSTIEYAITPDTATPGADYGDAVAAGVLTFKAGVASQTIRIPIVNDTLDEPDETLNLVLDNPSTGSEFGFPAEAVLTLRDNDTAGKVQFSAVSYNKVEGVNGSTVLATITVTRVNGTASGATVDYATSDGTATAGVDYTATTGTLTFGYNEKTKTFVVPILGDAEVEGNESVDLALSNPAGGAVLATPSAATLWIINR